MDRPFEILAFTTTSHVNTSIALMAINVPPGLIYDNYMALSYNARISKRLGLNWLNLQVFISELNFITYLTDSEQPKWYYNFDSYCFFME